MRRILVAGVGNIFFADDGFGPEVARRLAARPVPEGVSVADFGVRGMHLAYELTSGYDEAIVIDAVARGGAPGTLYVIEPDLGGATGSVAADAHGVDLHAVFAMANTLGRPPARVRVVGCEARELTDRIGLSDSVGQSVQEAVTIVESMLAGSAANSGVEEVGR
jgi:hydrogenase maturation protease